MDENVQYAVGRNVSRFYDEFVAEIDSSRRHLLRSILLAEEGDMATLLSSWTSRSAGSRSVPTTSRITEI